MQFKSFVHIAVLCLIFVAIGFAYFQPFGMQPSLLEGTLVQQLRLPVGSIGAQCTASRCTYCLVTNNNRDTCIFASINQCRANCAVGSSQPRSSAPTSSSWRGYPSSAPPSSSWGRYLSSIPTSSSWRGYPSSAPPFSSWGGYPSSALASSRQMSSTGSSVCRGDECALSGVRYCGTGGYVCEQTNELPCMRCVLRPASSGSSAASSVPSSASYADLSIILHNPRNSFTSALNVIATTFEMEVYNRGPSHADAWLFFHTGDLVFNSVSPSSIKCFPVSIGFPFIRCKIDGLSPNSTYPVSITLQTPHNFFPCDNNFAGVRPFSAAIATNPEGVNRTAAFDIYPQNNVSNVVLLPCTPQ